MVVRVCSFSPGAQAAAGHRTEYFDFVNALRRDLRAEGAGGVTLNGTGQLSGLGGVPAAGYFENYGYTHWNWSSWSDAQMSAFAKQQALHYVLAGIDQTPAVGHGPRPALICIDLCPDLAVSMLPECASALSQQRAPALALTRPRGANAARLRRLALCPCA